MTDLDRECAEAQGWINGKSKTYHAWWYLGDQPKSPVDAYHPPTDLNQAMTFAEWGLHQWSTKREVKCPSIRIELFNDGSGYMGFETVNRDWVIRVDICDHNLAEAMCRATLEAVKDE